MNLKQQVCSLELSRKLHELGVKQESLFYHQYNENAKTHITRMNGMLELYYNERHSAFTASELLELLPTDFLWNGDSSENVYLQIQKHINYYKVRYFDYDDTWFDWSSEEDSNLCNSLAKMLILLIENKLLEIK